MKTVNVTVYPYAAQHGWINIPDDTHDPYEYILDHLDEIHYTSGIEFSYDSIDIDFEE